jgi:hypothetical protein
LEEDVTHAGTHAVKVIFAAGSKNKNVIAVVEEGVKTFVMLSTIRADNTSVTDALEVYLKANQNADDYLRKSDLDYGLRRFGSLTDENGKGKVELDSKFGKSGSISEYDVAKTVVVVLENGIRKT